MNEYQNSREKTFRPATENVAQRKAGNNGAYFKDNRPATIQRQTQNSQPIQRTGEDLPPPTNSHLYGMARAFFGSYGSPQIAQIHAQMAQNNDPVLHQETGIMAGWRAGRHETDLLSRLPVSDDWRDRVGRHPVSSFFRPFAGAFAGGMLRSGYNATRDLDDPFNNY